LKLLAVLSELVHEFWSVFGGNDEFGESARDRNVGHVLEDLLEVVDLLFEGLYSREVIPELSLLLGLDPGYLLIAFVLADLLLGLPIRERPDVLLMGLEVVWNGLAGLCRLYGSIFRGLDLSALGFNCLGLPVLELPLPVGDPR